MKMSQSDLESVCKSEIFRDDRDTLVKSLTDLLGIQVLKQAQEIVDMPSTEGTRRILNPEEIRLLCQKSKNRGKEGNYR